MAGNPELGTDDKKYQRHSLGIVSKCKLRNFRLDCRGSQDHLIGSGAELYG